MHLSHQHRHRHPIAYLSLLFCWRPQARRFSVANPKCRPPDTQTARAAVALVPLGLVDSCRILLPLSAAAAVPVETHTLLLEQGYLAVAAD